MSPLNGIASPPFVGARPATPRASRPSGPAAAPPEQASPNPSQPPLAAPARRSPEPPRAPTGAAILGSPTPPDTGVATPVRDDTKTPPPLPKIADSSAFLPWLPGSDPATVGNADGAATHSDDAYGMPISEGMPGEIAAPEEAAQALAGLPYFDESGGKHEAMSERLDPGASGKMHRVEYDLAAVLENLAARVRSGDLLLPDVDPLAGEGAALASVLAALLRHRGR